MHHHNPLHFYPIFHYILEWLVTREFFNFWVKNPRFMIESGFKSREGYNGASTVPNMVLHNQSHAIAEQCSFELRFITWKRQLIRDSTYVCNKTTLIKLKTGRYAWY